MLKNIKNFLVLRDKNGKRYRKSIMLYGYYGMNLGDDLFFEKLLNRYPDTMFLVYCTENYREFFEKFSNAKFYSVEDDLVQKINKIGHKIGIRELFELVLLWRSSATVHIGGSIYQQIGDWRTDYNYRVRRKQPFKPFFSISSNFGAYTEKEFEELWRGQFKRYTDVCFRDKYSCRIFPDVKAVRYVPDLLFSYKIQKAREEKGSVAISVFNPFLEGRKIPREISESYKNAILKTATELLDEGRRVSLLSFCAFEGDEALVNELVAEIPESKRARLEYKGYNFYSKQEILDTLNTSEYIIGTRLHSIILGMVMGKKVLPLVYNQKIKNILDDIGFNGDRIDLDKMGDYAKNGFAEILGSTESFDVSELSSSDELQFKKLDKYFK